MAPFDETTLEREIRDDMRSSINRVEKNLLELEKRVDVLTWKLAVLIGTMEVITLLALKFLERI